MRLGKDIPALGNKSKFLSYIYLIMNPISGLDKELNSFFCFFFPFDSKFNQSVDVPTAATRNFVLFL